MTKKRSNRYTQYSFRKTKKYSSEAENWIENQINLSASIHYIIEDYVEKNGVEDVFLSLKSFKESFNNKQLQGTVENFNSTIMSPSPINKETHIEVEPLETVTSTHDTERIVIKRNKGNSKTFNPLDMEGPVDTEGW